MLTIEWLAVGKLKETYWKDACMEYIKRLRGFCKPTIIEIEESPLPRSPSPSQIKSALQSEGEKILSRLSSSSFPIALCVEGEMLGSEQLAKKIGQLMVDGCSNIAFVIGSSHGLDESVKSACRLRLSVSKMTFPHQLMRVMVLEQVYRSLSINAGAQYHK